MEANINKLSRITSGEIGFDQAIVDYFYYDPELDFQDFMSIGFFG